MDQVLGVAIGVIIPTNLIMGFKLWKYFVLDDDHQPKSMIAFLLGWPFWILLCDISLCKSIFHVKGKILGLDDEVWTTIGITGMMMTANFYVAYLFLNKSLCFWGQGNTACLVEILIMLLTVTVMQIIEGVNQKVFG